MNTVLSLLFFMVIGGALAGGVHNDKAEKCGGPQPLTSDTIISAITWPLIIGLAMTLDDENHLKIQDCYKESTDH